MIRVNANDIVNIIAIWEVPESEDVDFRFGTNKELAKERLVNIDLYVKDTYIMPVQVLEIDYLLEIMGLSAVDIRYSRCLSIGKWVVFLSQYEVNNIHPDDLKGMVEQLEDYDFYE